MRLKVLFVPTSNSGVMYWRFFNYVKSAYDYGIMDAKLLWWQKELFDTHPWEQDISSGLHQHRIRCEMMDWAKEADVIVFQYCHTRGALQMIREIRDANPTKPILCEIDDNILSVPSYNQAEDVYRNSSNTRDIVIAQMLEADGVITTTPFLQDVLSEFNQNIHIVPNCIDLDHWKVQNKNRPGIRIGWAGGGTHNDDLLQIGPVMNRILEAHREVKFVFLRSCPDEFRDMKGVEVISKWEPIMRYPRYLANSDFDIGIAPLQDNAFNRGKSNLRWLEYSALGIPTVAYIPTDSPGHTHFDQTIKNGEDGYVAHAENEFEKMLTVLIENRSLRTGMGLRAKDRISRDFNAKVITQNYADILASFVKQKNEEHQISTEGVLQ